MVVSTDIHNQASVYCTQDLIVDYLQQHRALDLIPQIFGVIYDARLCKWIVLHATKTMHSI